MLLLTPTFLAGDLVRTQLLMTPPHEKLRLGTMYCLVLLVHPEASTISQGWKPCAQLCSPFTETIIHRLVGNALCQVTKTMYVNVITLAQRAEQQVEAHQDQTLPMCVHLSLATHSHGHTGSYIMHLGCVLNRQGYTRDLQQHLILNSLGNNLRGAVFPREYRTGIHKTGDTGSL